MATVLIMWELGAGLGHVARLLPIASGLVQRGHRVYAAVRDLTAGHSILGGFVSLLQAPVQLRPPTDQIQLPFTFAHLLHNFGFANLKDLAGRIEAWSSVFDLVQPDLMLLDHSPTALLAARGHPARKALIGSGFFCPPDAHPLPNLRSWRPADQQQLRNDEARVLATMNRVLESRSQRPLDRITQLYAEVDENILVTFKELDHYQDRKGARYWGAWTKISGKSVEWPLGDGPRIYAYFKPVKQLPEILTLLARLGARMLIYSDGIPAPVIRRFTSASMRFETQPLDLAEIGRSCDLAILNANHGTTISMLMSGRPILQLPITLEQALLSVAVEKLGAALGANFERPDQVESAVQKMLASSSFASAASNFANRYADFDGANQAERVVTRLQELF
jgi:UDP:flavonoid glycosyltransferase YjiC (YdhE family)